jgi:hypothetical protein
MSQHTEKLVNEIEDIKVRLISVETTLIESEKATREDEKAVKEALKEYEKGRTKTFRC